MFYDSGDWGLEVAIPGLSVCHLKQEDSMIMKTSSLEKDSRLQAAGRPIKKRLSITWGPLWVISWLTWLARNQRTWAPRPVLSLPPSVPLSKHVP